LLGISLMWLGTGMCYAKEIGEVALRIRGCSGYRKYDLAGESYAKSNIF
jgi:hypothetical protein